MGYGEGGHKHLLFHEFHTIIAILLKPGHLARLAGGAGNSLSPPHYRLANPFITQGICYSTPCGKLFVCRFVFSVAAGLIPRIQRLFAAVRIDGQPLSHYRGLLVYKLCDSQVSGSRNWQNR